MKGMSNFEDIDGATALPRGFRQWSTQPKLPKSFTQHKDITQSENTTHHDLGAITSFICTASRQAAAESFQHRHQALSSACCRTHELMDKTMRQHACTTGEHGQSSLPCLSKECLTCSSIKNMATFQLPRRAKFGMKPL
jgi:hypothetical protein